MMRQSKAVVRDEMKLMEGGMASSKSSEVTQEDGRRVIAPVTACTS